ncbi:hypothetical protein KCP74_09330 [Salmonella enterica subsp. enterica]|nr:hypothetical protein KCP74_09330 [Salmonella enterica subsp. enterica]
MVLVERIRIAAAAEHKRYAVAAWKMVAGASRKSETIERSPGRESVEKQKG